jgi:hypothetical protein
MLRTERSVKLAAAIIVLTVAFAVVGSADALIPPQWKNCKAVNARYPHGIGKVGAHDKTAGEPVTNFKRSTKLYHLATGYNKGLDRDKDGIACEQR